MRFIIVILVFVFMACDDCEYNETRCKVNVAEICSSGGEWETLANCDDVSDVNGNIWACCSDPEGGHNCFPEDECVGGES